MVIFRVRANTQVFVIHLNTSIFQMCANACFIHLFKFHSVVLLFSLALVEIYSRYLKSCTTSIFCYSSPTNCTWTFEITDKQSNWKKWLKPWAWPCPLTSHFSISHFGWNSTQTFIQSWNKSCYKNDLQQKPWGFINFLARWMREMKSWVSNATH